MSDKTSIDSSDPAHIGVENEADRDLIAVARTAVPALVAEVERLTNVLRSVKPAMQAEQRRHAKARRRVDALERALRKIAEHEAPAGASYEMVAIARAALSEDPANG